MARRWRTMASTFVEATASARRTLRRRPCDGDRSSGRRPEVELLTAAPQTVGVAAAPQTVGGAAAGDGAAHSGPCAWSRRTAAPPTARRAADGRRRWSCLRRLVEGAGELVEGAGELVEGAGELVEGAGELVEGSGELVEGAGELVEGSGELLHGSGELVQGCR
ncbi:uncharacterized protein [Lolium perenne]|uniref:uncharacterized protein n=1 Tax=Lolium perenne TaxID=4522 RepID=UPI003A992996